MLSSYCPTFTHCSLFISSVERCVSIKVYKKVELVQKLLFMQPHDVDVNFTFVSHVNVQGLQRCGTFKNSIYLFYPKPRFCGQLRRHLPYSTTDKLNNHQLFNLLASVVNLGT